MKTHTFEISSSAPRNWSGLNQKPLAGTYDGVPDSLVYCEKNVFELIGLSVFLNSKID